MQMKNSISKRKPIHESTWFYFVLMIIGILAIIGLERIQ